MKESESSGSCLCGAVRITAGATSDHVGACHCSMCRKWGGGPLLAVDCGTNVQFDGAESLSVFASSDWAERGFCSKCGSHLFYRWKKANQYFIPAGLLDGDRKWIFDHQVFIDEKPSFFAF